MTSPSRRPAARASGAAAALADLFLLPVSALLSPENLAALEAWEARGARFLVYGSLAGVPQALLDRLGLSLAEPLEGEFTVTCGDAASGRVLGDVSASGAFAARIRVTPAFDGGGLREAPGGAGGAPAEILAEAIAPTGERRVLAARRGAFAFVRSVTPCDEIHLETRRKFDYAPPTQVFPVERLMREALAAVSGWSFAVDLPAPATLPPRTNLSRHDGAFLFHVFAPDTTAALRVRTPYGAPLVTERETRLADGAALWHPDKSWRVECRLFAEGQSAGIVSVKTSFAAYPGYSGRLQVKGLESATLRFFPPSAHCAPALQGAGSVELVRSNWNALAEPEAPQWEDTPDGPCAVWRNVSGPVYIAW